MACLHHRVKRMSLECEGHGQGNAPHDAQDCERAYTRVRPPPLLRKDGVAPPEPVTDLGRHEDPSDHGVAYVSMSDVRAWM